MFRGRSSAFSDGFAALWHEPALIAAELMWRWCFAVATWALGTAAAVFYLDSLTVTATDELLSSTLQPWLIWGVIRHIFQGSLSRLLWTEAVVLLGTVVLWSAAASAGRAATLGRLVAMFRTGDAEATSWRFGPVFLLQLLRAMWTVIAVACFCSSIALAIAMQGRHSTQAALWLVLGTTLAWLIGSTLNWYLGTAPLFCVRNGAGAMDALVQTVDFSTRYSGRIAGVNLGFFVLRAVWAGTMFFVVFAPIGQMRQMGAGWALVLAAGLVLIYCAGDDLMYLARLAAYTSLAEEDSTPPPVAEAPPPEPLPGPELAPPLPAI